MRRAIVGESHRLAGTTVAAAPAMKVTAPMSVWFAWLLVSATVVKATVGAILSSVSTTAALTPVLP